MNSPPDFYPESLNSRYFQAGLLTHFLRPRLPVYVG